MLKGTKKYYAFITLLHKAVGVYFGQFLVLYFFTVANYELLPIVTYYIFLYLFLGVGFFSIRHAMKSNNRVSYYRIGIALQALYLALIMLLKENIIYYAPLIGIIYGVGEGFYYFPHNVMYPNLIPDSERQGYDGKINAIGNLISILLPLVVGYFLTYFSYVEIAKVIFFFMVIIFFLSFGFRDEVYIPQKSKLGEFWNFIKQNKMLKKLFFAVFLAGFTFSSGALSLVVTVFTIFEYETSLNLGIITSVFAILTCFASYYFGKFMKKENFKRNVFLCILLYGISILLFGMFPRKSTILFYNFCNAICLHIASLIYTLYVNNYTNQAEIKKEFQTEYFLMIDLFYSISRVLSHLFVLFIALAFGVGALSYSLFLFAVCVFFFGKLLIQMVNAPFIKGGK